jgi:hypothetical protein
MQVIELRFRSDVDMGAHMRRAALDQVAQQAGALQARREVQLTQHAAFVLDAVG